MSRATNGWWCKLMKSRWFRLQVRFRHINVIAKPPEFSPHKPLYPTLHRWSHHLIKDYSHPPLRRPEADDSFKAPRGLNLLSIEGGSMNDRWR